MAGCSNDMKDVRRFERKDPPDQEIVNAHIWRSEQGKLMLELEAERIVRFRKPDTRTVYPKGLKMCFYDSERKPKTTLRADKATSYDDKDIIVASGHVTVVDYTNGDTIYLEDITWKSNEDIIFSNKPVRAVNGQRVTYGDGFVSDENMNNLRITRQRGTIEFND